MTGQQTTKHNLTHNSPFFVITDPVEVKPLPKRSRNPEKAHFERKNKSLAPGSRHMPLAMAKAKQMQSSAQGKTSFSDVLVAAHEVEDSLQNESMPVPVRQVTAPHPDVVSQVSRQSSLAPPFNGNRIDKQCRGALNTTAK